MYTETQIDNAFKSTGTSFRTSGKREGGIRKFDIEIVELPSHKHVTKFTDKMSVEAGIIEATAWLIKNRNASTVAPGTMQATESRVSQLEAELAKTNELLKTVLAAKAEAPATTEESSEGGEPKRGRRKKEKPPERAADDEPIL